MYDDLSKVYVTDQSEISSETLYARSRDASNALRKLLMAFSVGLLAFIFSSMVSTQGLFNNELALKILLILCAFCFFTGCMAGVFAIYCDAKYNFFWAKQKQSEYRKVRVYFRRKHVKYRNRRRYFDWLLRIFFGLGMVVFLTLTALLV